MLMVLSGPPFLDYELAIVAPIAFRTRPGLRDQITQPIFGAFDLFLLLGLLIYVGRVLFVRRARLHFPWWCSLCIVLLTVIGSFSGMAVMTQFPLYSSTIVAGLVNMIRVPLTVITTLACLDDGFYQRETCCLLSLGLVMFCVESLYVTWVKHGTINLLQTQITGIIPGPGATGAVLIMTAPVLFAWFVGGVCRGKVRYLVILTIILCSVFALATYTRSILVGGWISLLTMSLQMRKRIGIDISRILTVCVVFVLITIVTLRFGPDFFAKKLASMFHDSPTENINLRARLDYWESALVCMQAEPLVGIGPLMWGIRVGRGVNAHNAFLQYGAENGVLALIIYACSWIAVLIFLLRERYSGELVTETTRIGIGAGLLGLVVSQLFSNSMYDVRIIFLSWTWVTVGLTSTRYRFRGEVS
jgi:hypothetical protein